MIDKNVKSVLRVKSSSKFMIDDLFYLLGQIVIEVLWRPLKRLAIHTEYDKVDRIPQHLRHRYKSQTKEHCFV